MLIPRLGSEVSADWVTEVIQTYERKTKPNATFSLTNLEVKQGTKPGENFNSELVSVEVNGEIRDAEEDGTDEKNYSLMLKFHSTDVFNKEINKFGNNHIKEINLYSQLHSKLMKFQEENCGCKYKLNIPDCLYSINEGEDYVIVMKNLKTCGYVTNDKTKGLDFPQLKLAVTQIARWHALAYVYNKKFNILKEFPEFNPNINMFEAYSPMFRNSIQGIAKFASSQEEFGNFSEKLKNGKLICEKLSRLGYVEDFSKTNSLCSLLHGDFWNNNLLFLYDNDTNEKKCPCDVSIVDWQMCGWGKVVIDLHYLLHTSTTYQIRRDHLEDVLITYYKTFEEITNELSYPLPVSYNAFKQEFEELSSLGFMYGILLVPGTLSKAGEKINRSDNVSNNVRGLSYKMKSKCAKRIISIMFKPSMKFLIRKVIKKITEPFSKELEEGSNEIMNSRLKELIQEAIDKGTFDEFSS